MRTLSNFSDLESLLLEKGIEYEVSMLDKGEVYANAYWVENKLHIVVSSSFYAWKNILEPVLLCLKNKNLIRDFSVQKISYKFGDEDFSIVEFAIVVE